MSCKDAREESEMTVVDCICFSRQKDVLQSVDEIQQSSRWRVWERDDDDEKTMHAGRGERECMICWRESGIALPARMPDAA